MRWWNDLVARWLPFPHEYLMDNLFLLDIDGISLWDDVAVCIESSLVCTACSLNDASYPHPFALSMSPFLCPSISHLIGFEYCGGIVLAFFWLLDYVCMGWCGYMFWNLCLAVLDSCWFLFASLSLPSPFHPFLFGSFISPPFNIYLPICHLIWNPSISFHCLILLRFGLIHCLLILLFLSAIFNSCLSFYLPVYEFLPFALMDIMGVVSSVVVAGLIRDACLCIEPSIFHCSWYSCWYFPRIIIFTQSSCSRGKSFCPIHLKTHLSFPPHNQIHALHRVFGVALMDGCFFLLYFGLWHGFFYISQPSLFLLSFGLPAVWCDWCGEYMNLGCCVGNASSLVAWFIVSHPVVIFPILIDLCLIIYRAVMVDIVLNYLLYRPVLEFLPFPCRCLLSWLLAADSHSPAVSLSFLWIFGLLISLYHHPSIKLQCSSSSIWIDCYMPWNPYPLPLCVLLHYFFSSSSSHFESIL